MKFISTSLTTLALYSLTALAAPGGHRSAKLSEILPAAGGTPPLLVKSSTPLLKRCSHLIAGPQAQASIVLLSVVYAESSFKHWDKTSVVVDGSRVNCFVSDTLVALPWPGGVLRQCGIVVESFSFCELKATLKEI
ncbi:hypothetical protein B0H14DRAFT_2645866 [Mycena olivaceomarginata]|nr:hypothetical protein B0H14DRAFT_2645866 [Mycena olivaceomarginata]